MSPPKCQVKSSEERCLRKSERQPCRKTLWDQVSGHLGSGPGPATAQPGDSVQDTWSLWTTQFLPLLALWYVLEVKSICLSPRPLGLFFPHVLSFRNVAWHVVGSWVLISLKTRPVGSEARSGPDYLCHVPSRSAGGRDPPPVLRSCSESVSQTLSLPRNLLGPPARDYKPLLSFIVPFE